MDTLTRKQFDATVADFAKPGNKLGKAYDAVQATFITAVAWLLTQAELSPERADYTDVANALNQFATRQPEDAIKVARWLRHFTPMQPRVSQETGIWSFQAMPEDTDMEKFAGEQLESLTAHAWQTALPKGEGTTSPRAHDDLAVQFSDRVVKMHEKRRFAGWSKADIERIAKVAQAEIATIEAEKKAARKEKRASKA